VPARTITIVSGKNNVLDMLLYITNKTPFG